MRGNAYRRGVPLRTCSLGAHVISIGNGQSLDSAASCFCFRRGGVHHPQVMEPALELKGRVTFTGLFVMLDYDGRTNPGAPNDGYRNGCRSVLIPHPCALLRHQARKLRSRAPGVW
jgi:hypothetical protein